MLGLLGSYAQTPLGIKPVNALMIHPPALPALGVNRFIFMAIPPNTKERNYQKIPILAGSMGENVCRKKLFRVCFKNFDSWVVLADDPYLLSNSRGGGIRTPGTL